ncbi:hypothetical protein ACBQ16_13615 [Halopseudomonas bauzanensis]|uniref:hypothetical protein n=1 Tax=Halopseudomonas bauzanensis TaxID=653930 RepID=UPI0025552DFD|nr:hypothetical protein [Halopseudomonas bauzanensis]
MYTTVAEFTLRRVLAWLHWAGREPTPELQAAVLRTMADNIGAPADELFDLCLQPQRAGIEPPPIAPATPPLRRGSIGYGDY